jgi:hypothetical protein
MQKQKVSPQPNWHTRHLLLTLLAIRMTKHMLLKFLAHLNDNTSAKAVAGILGTTEH